MSPISIADSRSVVVPDAPARCSDPASQYREWTSQLRTLHTLAVERGLDQAQVCAALAQHRNRPGPRPGRPRTGRRSHSRAYYQSLLDVVTGIPPAIWPNAVALLTGSRFGGRPLQFVEQEP